MRRNQSVTDSTNALRRLVAMTAIFGNATVDNNNAAVSSNHGTVAGGCGVFAQSSNLPNTRELMSTANPPNEL